MCARKDPQPPPLTFIDPSRLSPPLVASPFTSRPLIRLPFSRVLSVGHQGGDGKSARQIDGEAGSSRTHQVCRDRSKGLWTEVR